MRGELFPRHSNCALFYLASGGREKRKPAQPGGPIYLEVALVEGEDAAQFFPLSDSHQRRVGKIHGKIPVLSHQLPHSRNVAFVKRQQTHRAAIHHLPESLLSLRRKIEEVHRFGEDRPYRSQRLTQRLQNGPATIMVLIIRVNQRDKRSGVHQNHPYLGFFLTSS
jgi:hypothetical protein